MPILIDSLIVVSAGQDASTLTTAAFTPIAGEIIVVKGLIEDSGVPGSLRTLGTPTGGGLTYTQRVVDGTVSHCYVSIWTAKAAGATASMTVSSTYTNGTSPGFHAMVVERWGNAKLAAAPATCDTLGTGAPSATLTTVADNSVVSWANGDWSAQDGASRTYQSSAVEELYTRPGTGTSYTGYVAYQQCGTSGGQTVGLTAPTGQTYSLLGVEVQHQSTPIIVSKQAVMRAATW